MVVTCSPNSRITCVYLSMAFSPSCSKFSKNQFQLLKYGSHTGSVGVGQGLCDFVPFLSSCGVFIIHGLFSFEPGLSLASLVSNYIYELRVWEMFSFTFYDKTVIPCWLGGLVDI